MADNCDQLPVLRGNNRWVLARTDRDAVNLTEAIETGAAFVQKTLGAASPTNTRNLFEVLPIVGTDARYIIGAACPARLTAAQPETALETLQLAQPAGRVLGSYMQCPVLRTVNAQRPWVVFVDFDWRAPDTMVPWPKRLVNDLGFPLEGDFGLDWLLLGASYTGAAREPTCKGWMSEQVAGVKKEAEGLFRSVVPWVVLGVVGVGLGVGIALSRKATK